MTQSLKLLLGSATAFTLVAATPVFAQVTDPEPTAEEMVDTLEQSAEDIEAVAEELEDDTEAAAEMDEAAEEHDAMTDDKTWDADVDTTDAATNEIVTVTCPEGTELQDDGSCMATGEWTPEG